MVPRRSRPCQFIRFTTNTSPMTTLREFVEWCTRRIKIIDNRVIKRRNGARPYSHNLLLNGRTNTTGNRNQNTTRNIGGRRFLARWRIISMTSPMIIYRVITTNREQYLIRVRATNMRHRSMINRFTDCRRINIKTIRISTSFYLTVRSTSGTQRHSRFRFRP